MLLFGFYPPEQYWRPIMALFLLLVALAPIVFKSLPRLMLCFATIYPVIAYYLIWGGFGLEVVASRSFGGLLLTFIIATAGIAIAIPSGIFLALGRQFLIAPLRAICALIIGFVRGVSLLVLLFSALILGSLFLPPGTFIDSIFMVIAAVALHTGVRIAGAIREELVALPKGQWEAARALGIGDRKAIRIIILPQVLRSYSPWIVLPASGVLRDTTILSLFGFFDPIALMDATRANVKWRRSMWELFVFVGFFYWFFCFCMSCFSRHLERKLEAEGCKPINLSQQIGTRTTATDSTA